jgi:hypothetical protein
VGLAYHLDSSIGKQEGVKALANNRMVVGKQSLDEFHGVSRINFV